MRICAEQDCNKPSNRPDQPLCYDDYQAFRDWGSISLCFDCEVTYKPAECSVCRNCYRARAVETVRWNINRYWGLCTNHETNTIDYLVTPLLEGLGWNPKNPGEIVREYPPTGKRWDGRYKKVDVALFEGKNPKVFIEAKRLDRDLGDPQYMDQLERYAYSMCGGFAVLTNGQHWQIYEVIEGRLRSNLLNADILNGSDESVADQLNGVIGRTAVAARRWARQPTSEQITDALKSYRNREAKSRRTPAYNIFIDATIARIAERKPTNIAELQSIKGVGSTTLKQHGEAILEIVAGRMK